jgi:hypothetical protein
MNTGDKVILKCDDGMFDGDDDSGSVEDWRRMTGTVLEGQDYDPRRHTRIQPDTQRPDGQGTEWFYWPDNLISKAE